MHILLFLGALIPLAFGMHDGGASGRAGHGHLLPLALFSCYVAYIRCVRGTSVARVYYDAPANCRELRAWLHPSPYRKSSKRV